MKKTKNYTQTITYDACDMCETQLLSNYGHGDGVASAARLETWSKDGYYDNERMQFCVPCRNDLTAWVKSRRPSRGT